MVSLVSRVMARLRPASERAGAGGVVLSWYLCVQHHGVVEAGGEAVGELVVLGGRLADHEHGLDDVLHAGPADLLVQPPPHGALHDPRRLHGGHAGHLA